VRLQSAQRTAPGRRSTRQQFVRSQNQPRRVPFSTTRKEPRPLISGGARAKKESARGSTKGPRKPWTVRKAVAAEAATLPQRSRTPKGTPMPVRTDRRRGPRWASIAVSTTKRKASVMVEESVGRVAMSASMIRTRGPVKATREGQPDERPMASRGAEASGTRPEAKREARVRVRTR
jgi:hypothetical protein